jgi:AcrR family transcriptional regulator
MTQEPETTSRKVAKLNRVERNAWTKRKIFDAATRIVGKYGYAEASVARSTEEAGVAQGTFYNHFENRQQLLDQLLPKIGMDMVCFIRDRTGTAHAARQEIEPFGAFFDFIREVP